MLDIKDIKSPIYEAPEGYFEELEVKIMSYVNRDIRREKRQTLLRKLYMGVSAAAAMVAIYIGTTHISYTDISYNDSIEITSAEELNDYVIKIQQVYAADASDVTNDTYESTSATEFYLSHIEEMTLNNSSSTTMTEDEEFINYNIMELASL